MDQSAPNDGVSKYGSPIPWTVEPLTMKVGKEYVLDMGNSAENQDNSTVNCFVVIMERDR